MLPSRKSYKRPNGLTPNPKNKMKIENTLENKAKFFAQYWAQKCIIVSEKAIVKQNIDSYFINRLEVYNECFLELTPLSQITDEDAIEVAIQLGWIDHEEITQIHYAKEFLNNEEDDNCSFKSYCFIVDYLRSKGYALPYMGLSVEELISYGWIKIAPQIL